MVHGARSERGTRSALWDESVRGDACVQVNMVAMDAITETSGRCVMEASIRPVAGTSCCTTKCKQNDSAVHTRSTDVWDGRKTVKRTVVAQRSEKVLSRCKTWQDKIPKMKDDMTRQTHKNDSDAQLLIRVEFRSILLTHFVRGMMSSARWINT